MTAQDVLNQEENQTAGTACWTACGASEESKPEEPTPAACGTACWAWE